MSVVKDPITTFLKWVFYQSNRTNFGVACIQPCYSYTDAANQPTLSSVTVQFNPDARRVSFRGVYTPTSDGVVQSFMFGVLVSNIPAFYEIFPANKRVAVGNTYDVYAEISYSVQMR